MDDKKGYVSSHLITEKRRCKNVDGAISNGTIEMVNIKDTSMTSPEQMGLPSEGERIREDFDKLSNNPTLQQILIKRAHQEAIRMDAAMSTGEHDPRSEKQEIDDFVITPAMRDDAARHEKHLRSTLPASDLD